MDAFQQNLTDLGTKLKGGAEKFAADHEEDINTAKAKAEELKAKAEGALAGNNNEGDEPSGEEAVSETACATSLETASTTSQTTSIAVKAAAFASKVKPEFATPEEGSIADIFLKAKAKVFGTAAAGAAVAADAENTNAIGDEDATGTAEADQAASPPPATAGTETETATESEGDTEEAAGASPESYPGDVVMEELQKEVNDIAAKMEAAGKDIADNEEVQKVMVPLLAQLSIAQQKFASFTSKNKKEDETVKEEGEAEEPTGKAKEDDDDDEGKLPSHYKANNLKYEAETKVKRALANAEVIAKDLAVKVGILDGGGSESDAAAAAPTGGSDGEDKTETEVPAETKTSEEK